MVDFPAPPIARVPGHLPGCYDSCGNYRKCVAGCPADAAWDDPDVRGRAYAEHEPDVQRWLAYTAEQRQGVAK